MKRLTTIASRLLNRVLAPLALVAGLTARVALRYGAGLAGAACLVVGFAKVTEAAGWLAAGALLMVLDRKVP